MNNNIKALIKTTSYINGEWVASRKNTFTVYNPSNQSEVARVDDADESLVENAIIHAHAALSAWRSKTAQDRAKLLRVWYNLIIENQDALATIMTMEQGKPFKESRGEIIYGASFIEWFSEEARRIYGEIISPPSNDRRLLTLRQGIGVVGAITPWNFPNAMITRKAAPALAAGCTIVIKPASLTPLSALALAELSAQAGIPKGVFNVVTCSNSQMAGKLLTTHPLIRKFTFTGSTQIGKLLMSQTVSTVKKVSMELGGNAPFIVFEDADIEKAVKGLMIAKFRNAGQTCVCANRIFVHKDIYKEFTNRIVEEVKKLNLGDGMTDGVDIGPLISKDAVDSVDALVKKAIAQGAKVLLGGKLSPIGQNFYIPTVISDVNVDMDLSCSEQFGPILAFIPFESERQVIDWANDTIYGLASYFYTENYQRQWRVSEALDFGLVGINEGLISTVVAPFGGFKQSGIGREGSKHGIEDYLEYKYVCVGGLE
ncbi:MAG: NAD-dependent succinate-semialdehyde dehydrogenase [Methylacidiphilales bacterium]|nr:NAD-dependent succinate-semialdehyde dehydrogenase [Candidatus Methylacidiphilales bacterium]